MALCSLCPILVLFLYLTLAKAAFSVSPELTKFIPSCAQECFESFLDANYDESKGGSSPSLQFFCSTKSTSGNTVGEGAVSCIISEDNDKFCTGSDADGTSPRRRVEVLLTGPASVVAEALEMCNGQPNALPNTHSTITATLVMGISGVVLISPATTSSPATRSSSSGIRTISRATSTPALVTSSLPQTKTTITSSVTSLPPTQKSPENTGLSKNQIVGISVAGVGGAAIAMGGILVLVCLRRRNLSRRGSDMLPFQADPAASQMYGGGRTPPGKQNLGWWGGTPTPPPVPPRLEISPPNMFSRRSIVPDSIVLPVSPDQPKQDIRRSSKLLPEKPILRLVMPNESLLPKKQIQRRGPIPSTQSTVTQFEEDDRPQYEQIETSFRGPDISISTTIDAFPSVPRNHTAGNPASSIMESNNGSSYTRYISQNPNTGRAFAKPLNADRPKRHADSFSKPLQRAQDFPQPRLLEISNPNTLRPLTQASSLYSQQTPHSAGASFYNAPSIRQLSTNISEANTQAPRPTSYRQVGPCDRGSSSSLTSFESEDTSQGKKDFSTARTSQGFRKSVVELSPVIGSPSSGKSPVSYPKIPAPVRLTAKTMKIVPPPPQPDFRPVFSSRSNQNANLANKPWLAAEIAAQQQRNVRREELRLSTATRPSPQLAKRDLLPAAQIRERWNPPPGGVVNDRNQYTKTNALLPLSSQQQILSRPLPPQPQWQTQSQSDLRPLIRRQMQSLPQLEASNLRPGVFLPRHSRSSSTNSANSTSSPLLAKRVGADKAATLRLASKPDSRDKSRPGWRILKQDEIQAAKDPGWRPQLLHQIQSGKPKNEANNETGDMGPGSGGGLPSSKSVRSDVKQDRGDTTPPPVTPGWVPKLTPTRRGDELFLSVQ